MKTERINIRTTKQLKDKIARIAQKQGVPVADTNLLWGPVESDLPGAPLNKGGTGFWSKSPFLRGMRGGSRYVQLHIKLVSDDAGLIEMFTLNIDYFQSKPLDIPKITILLDHGYHPEYLSEDLELIYPQIVTKIQF